MDVHALDVGDVKHAQDIGRVRWRKMAGLAVSHPVLDIEIIVPGCEPLRKPGRMLRSEGPNFLSCSSSAAQKMRVRSPTSLATRK